MNRRIMALCFAVLAMLLVASPASAHKHTLDPDGKDGGKIVKGNGEDVVLAGGQNHAPFEVVEVDNVDMAQSCGGDDAAYGLESAHHGPDDGTPGKSDGSCYSTTDYGINQNGVVVPADDNPAFN